MKHKPIRRFPTGNAPPQKVTLPVKAHSGLEDELYYVRKEHIVSSCRPIGLLPIGRFLSFYAVCVERQKYFSQNWRLAGSSFNAIRLISGKGVPHRKIPPQKGGE